MWGRIEGVHYQFSEEGILAQLVSQGVEKVRRVQYTAFQRGSESVRAEKRNTDKVDLKFIGGIRKEISFLGQSHQVTLIAPPPIQCMKCLRFNHRKDTCVAKDIICATCGQAGHMATQCQRRPHCCNCKQNHHAMSTSCPIYQIWANAAKEKYECSLIEQTRGRIVSTVQPQIRNDSQSVAHNPVEVQTQGEPRSKSYAEVVEKRQIVVMGENGEEVIVGQLAPKAQIKAAKPRVVLNPHSREEIKDTSKGGSGKIEKGKESKVLKVKIDGFIEKLVSFLKALEGKYPEIGLLLVLIEEGKELLRSHLL